MPDFEPAKLGKQNRLAYLHSFRVFYNFVVSSSFFQMVNTILRFFEQQTFGVCTWLGDKLRMKSSEIRLFFIYSSFLTLGSPLILYMQLAFILKIKEYIQSSRSRVWDL